MALFMDGAISVVEDLIAYEGAIPEVAVTEQIDLTVKLGLADEEVGIDLSVFLAGRPGAPSLENIVVTDPLRKWHTFRTLVLVYRDAYHRQLNDRYLAKWKEYLRLAQWAREALMQTGVGMTGDPLARAAKPELSDVPAALGAATYYARAAWRNSAGEEGSPSEVAILVVPDGKALVVTPADPPAQAVAWNVYVGLAVSEQTLQNDVPMPLYERWTEPGSGIRQGTPFGSGQTPTYYLRPGPQVLWG